MRRANDLIGVAIVRIATRSRTIVLSARGAEPVPH
jgi:hypothetical protein